MSLLSLLDDATRFDPEFDAGLSNHLPMALVALHRLGADEARLSAFAAHYSRRLRPAPPVEGWPSGDPWPGRLGQPEAWPVYRDLFGQWLAHEGIGDLLNQVLPVLLPGCSAAAFHGLIRTAYAVQAVHAQGLADALAYWACRHQRLGELPASADDTDESDPIVLLRQLPAGRSTARLIVDRMREAAREAPLQRVIGRLRTDGDTGERLSRAAAWAYAGSGNFTALHLVTSAHALRTLIPFVDEPAGAWRWYWQAFAFGVVAARLQPLPPVEVLPWERLVEAALGSDDDHLIKLVDSCREEERAYGGNDWQRAASRAVHQVWARRAGEE